MCEWTWNEWKKVTLRDHCLFTTGPHLLQRASRGGDAGVSALQPASPPETFFQHLLPRHTALPAPVSRKDYQNKWNFANFSQSEGYLLYKEIKAVPASVTQRSFNQVTLRQYCKNIVRKPHIQLNIVICQPVAPRLSVITALVAQCRVPADHQLGGATRCMI